MSFSCEETKAAEQFINHKGMEDLYSGAGSHDGSMSIESDDIIFTT
jgi:hypothetical protein